MRLCSNGSRSWSSGSRSGAEPSDRRPAQVSSLLGDIACVALNTRGRREDRNRPHRTTCISERTSDGWEAFLGSGGTGGALNGRGTIERLASFHTQ